MSITPDSLDDLGGKCSTEWRIEALDLVTGARKRILKPVSFNFEEVLNEVGNASVTLNVNDVRMNDVWPHTTKIAFLRIAGPDATPSSPVCEFVGLVETVSAESGGTMTLGLKSIEEYLAHRYIRLQLGPMTLSQTFIGKMLVDGAMTGSLFGLPGIPLSGDYASSTVMRERTYLVEDRKTVLEAIRELTEIADGPDYVLTHSPDGSSSTMTFYDEAGGSAVLNAKRGIISYSLDVSADNHANRIVALGDNNIGTVESSIPAGHPAWERVENYSEVALLPELVEHAQGSLANDKSPAATPQVTVAGLDLIAPLGLGDTVHLTMGNGALQYKGTSRLVGISWSSDEGSPTTATLTFTPGTAGVDSVLNAPVTRSGCCGGPV